MSVNRIVILDYQERCRRPSPPTTAVEADDELRARGARPRWFGVECIGGMSHEHEGRPDVSPHLFIPWVDIPTRTVGVRSTCGVRWPVEVLRKLLDVREDFVGTRIDQRNLYLMQARLDEIADEAVNVHGMWWDSFEKMWVPG